MIVCVAPSPSVDRQLLLAEPVVPGAIHRPGRVVAVAGGKGLNVARAAAALGAEVRVVAPLGGASGRWIEDGLAAAGIDVRRVATDAETRVCVSVAGSGQALTEFYEPAPALTPEQWAALEAAVRDAAGGADWVTLSGSLPAGSPDDAAERLVAAAHAGGARVALDASGDALRSGLRAEPELVKVNAREARELLGPGARARALRCGDGTACITDGDAGLELAAGGVVLSALPPVRGEYPVGCGDVTLAALVVGRGDGWRAAVALAAAAAAVAAEVPGAGVLDTARAWRLADAVTIHEVPS